MVIFYFTTTNLATVNPTDVMASGYIYDFVLFTTENSGTSSTALVAVSSNNTSWGNAIVKTDSPTSDGKYPLNSSVTVQAIKANLCDFIGWSNGIEIVSTQAEYTFTVNAPVYLIAVFNTLTTILETPQTSTAGAPVWYQIKNAQTDDRLNRFIAYEESIPAGYTTALRIQKPEDLTDKFLWRLEASNNEMVKVVNRGANMQITSTGVNGVTLTASAVGSDFMLAPSGNANGSFSLKYNNVGTSLLNGDLGYKLLLYNGGAGTGSGWYFYRVPADLFSGISKTNNSKYNVYSKQDFLFLEGMESGSQVNVYNLLGHSLLKYQVNSDKEQVSFSQKGVFLVLVQSNGAQLNTFKIIR